MLLGQAAAAGQGLGGPDGGPPPHASPLASPGVCGSSGAKPAPGQSGPALRCDPPAAPLPSRRGSRDGGCAGTAAARRGQRRCARTPRGPGSFLAPPSPPVRAAAGQRHLPMSELQKASCGWMGTQVQASTTKSRRLQLHKNTTRKLSHAVMLPLRCLLTSAEREAAAAVFAWLYSCSLTARAPRLAACPAAVSVSLSGGSLGAEESRGEPRCGALQAEQDRRAELYPARAARAPGAPPRAANGSAALPHRRERGAGPRPPRLIGNRAGARRTGARSGFWTRPALIRSSPTRSGFRGAGEASLRPSCTSLLPAGVLPSLSQPPRAAPQGTWKTCAGLAARLESSRCFPSVRLVCLQTDFKLESWHAIQGVRKSFQTTIR